MASGRGEAPLGQEIGAIRVGETQNIRVYNLLFYRNVRNCLRNHHTQLIRPEHSPLPSVPNMAFGIFEPHMHPGTISRIWEIAGDKLQNLSFHHHLVARDYFEN